MEMAVYGFRGDGLYNKQHNQVDMNLAIPLFTMNDQSILHFVFLVHFLIENPSLSQAATHIHDKTAP